ncbi:hypothetical protein Dimus_030680 [Dionaea muscipula]
MTLRSASPPPQRKNPLPPLQTAEGSIGNEPSVESTALVKRKRALAGQSLVAVARNDDEIIFLTVGREKEYATDDATTKVVEHRGELELPDLSLLGDDATLREYLITLNKIEVSDEKVTDVAAGGSKDVASPLQKKRKLTKGGVMTSWSKEVGEGKVKDVTAATTVVPVAES